MGEQERYKKLLKKVIDETESKKIKTTEELIKTLVHELTNKNSLESTQNLAK